MSTPEDNRQREEAKNKIEAAPLFPNTMDPDLSSTTTSDRHIQIVGADAPTAQGVLSKPAPEENHCHLAFDTDKPNSLNVEVSSMDQRSTDSMDTISTRPFMENLPSNITVKTAGEPPRLDVAAAAPSVQPPPLSQVPNPTTPSQPVQVVKKNKDERKREKEKDKQFRRIIQDEEDKNKIVGFTVDRKWIKYKFQVGAGSFKNVHLGYDTDQAQGVAWCEYKLQKGGSGVPSEANKDKRQTMIKEIEYLMRLSHPNIVRLLHHTQEWINVEDKKEVAVKGVVLITELMGCSLRSSLQKYHVTSNGEVNLPYGLFGRWWREILDALEYMHKHNLIHRDLKADNCFVYSRDGDKYTHVKIGDFGLAAELTSSRQGHTIIGTFGFMAPEIFNESYDSAVDIYAFGMVMYEVLTNKLPSSTKKPFFHGMLNALIYNIPAEVAQMRRDAALIIRACLHPMPEFRPSAEDLKWHPLFNPECSENESTKRVLSLPIAVEPNTTDSPGQVQGTGSSAPGASSMVPSAVATGTGSATGGITSTITTQNIASVDVEVNKKFLNWERYLVDFVEHLATLCQPVINLRLKVRDPRVLQEMELSKEEVLEFDFDIYRGEEELDNVVNELKREYASVMEKVFALSPLSNAESSKRQADRVYASIRSQLRFYQVMLLGMRAHVIFLDQNPELRTAEGLAKVGQDAMNQFSIYAHKWDLVRKDLKKEMADYVTRFSAEESSSSTPVAMQSLETTVVTTRSNTPYEAVTGQLSAISSTGNMSSIQPSVVEPATVSAPNRMSQPQITTTPSGPLFPTAKPTMESNLMSDGSHSSKPTGGQVAPTTSPLTPASEPATGTEAEIQNLRQQMTLLEQKLNTISQQQHPAASLPPTVPTTIPLGLDTGMPPGTLLQHHFLPQQTVMGSSSQTAVLLPQAPAYDPAALLALSGGNGGVGVNMNVGVGVGGVVSPVIPSVATANILPQQTLPNTATNLYRQAPGLVLPGVASNILPTAVAPPSVPTAAPPVGVEGRSSVMKKTVSGGGAPQLAPGGSLTSMSVGQMFPGGVLPFGTPPAAAMYPQSVPSTTNITTATTVAQSTSTPAPLPTSTSAGSLSTVAASAGASSSSLPRYNHMLRMSSLEFMCEDHSWRMMHSSGAVTSASSVIAAWKDSVRGPVRITFHVEMQMNSTDRQSWSVAIKLNWLEKDQSIPVPRIFNLRDKPRVEYNLRITMATMLEALRQGEAPRLLLNTDYHFHPCPVRIGNVYSARVQMVEAPGAEGASQGGGGGSQPHMSQSSEAVEGGRSRGLMSPIQHGAGQPLIRSDSDMSQNDHFFSATSSLFSGVSGATGSTAAAAPSANGPHLSRQASAEPLWTDDELLRDLHERISNRDHGTLVLTFNRSQVEAQEPGYRLFDIPPASLFAGIYEEDGRLKHIIKQCRGLPLLIAQDSNPEVSPRFFQAPTQGAAVINPMGVIKQLDTPHIILPITDAVGHTLWVNELPLDCALNDQIPLSAKDKFLLIWEQLKKDIRKINQNVLRQGQSSSSTSTMTASQSGNVSTNVPQSSLPQQTSGNSLQAVASPPLLSKVSGSMAHVTSSSGASTPVNTNSLTGANMNTSAAAPHLPEQQQQQQQQHHQQQQQQNAYHHPTQQQQQFQHLTPFSMDTASPYAFELGHPGISFLHFPPAWREAFLSGQLTLQQLDQATTQQPSPGVVASSTGSNISTNPSDIIHRHHPQTAMSAAAVMAMQQQQQQQQQRFTNVMPQWITASEMEATGQGGLKEQQQQQQQQQQQEGGGGVIDSNVQYPPGSDLSQLLNMLPVMPEMGNELYAGTLNQLSSASATVAQQTQQQQQVAQQQQQRHMMYGTSVQSTNNTCTITNMCEDNIQTNMSAIPSSSSTYSTDMSNTQLYYGGSSGNETDMSAQSSATTNMSALQMQQLMQMQARPHLYYAPAPPAPSSATPPTRPHHPNYPTMGNMQRPAIHPGTPTPQQMYSGGYPHASAFAPVGSNSVTGVQTSMIYKPIAQSAELNLASGTNPYAAPPPQSGSSNASVMNQYLHQQSQQPQGTVSSNQLQHHAYYLSPQTSQQQQQQQHPPSSFR